LIKRNIGRPNRYRLRKNDCRGGVLKKKARYFTLTIVMLLGLYPICELTKTILVGGLHYYPELSWQFAIELTLMWTMYLSIIPVFVKLSSPNLNRLHQFSAARPKNRTEKKPGSVALAESPKEDYIPVKFIN
jgi:hypothetical protein